jgi:hypothetical protein
MHARFIAFGQIEIDGQRFGPDVAGCGGGRRDSRRPTGIVTDTSRWSPDEAIPWSTHRLIVGTGAAGQLPITPELYLGVPLGRSTSARIVMCCGTVMCCCPAVAALGHAR